MEMRIPPPSAGQEILEDWKDLAYSSEFVETLCKLELQSHDQDNPEKIAMNALTTVAEFYDADWCGVVEADLIFHIWNPIWWTSGKTHNDVVRKFFEQDKISPSEEWINALHQGKCMIIEDTSVYKDTNPEEYADYKNLDIDSLIAYPFWKNPAGFLIVLNPKKHKRKVSLIQVLSFVVYSAISEARHTAGSNRAFTVDEIRTDKDIVINLFGSFEIHTLKSVLREDEINSPKIIRILTYLLLNPNQYCSPRRLCDAIWPDEIIDNPSSKIKSLIYRLHTLFSDVLDHKLIISTYRGYQLNPELNIVTDLQLFEDYWLLSQKTLSSKAKIEILKKLTIIYRGSLLSSATGEHWLLNSEIGFHHKYMGIINDLLKAFFEAENYDDIQEYASKALIVDNANKEVYYWLIKAMYKLGANGMARGELRNAERLLSDEEYQVLLSALNGAI